MDDVKKFREDSAFDQELRYNFASGNEHVAGDLIKQLLAPRPRPVPTLTPDARASG
jgi:hypothetical protein